MHCTYPARVEGHEGDYVATFRDMPEANGGGASHQEALESAKDGLEAALWFRLKDGESIPEPSKAKRGEVMIPVAGAVAVKAVAIRAIQRAGVSRCELAEKMGVDEDEISRLLDPRRSCRMKQLDEMLLRLGWSFSIGLAPFTDQRALAQAGDEDAEDELLGRIAKQRENEPATPLED
ncbi:type II toxin-antitoxin system HicB family antitoxin [Methyloligella halotolerans]|uniref:type II toxin-antitoxin system HicB family antitoxin n=1 Tax=Methyloligella halotolerans TaxID=1177755 RepID=UPI00083E6448|nr:type II toxin-antitoxin system HicB family antitoxin [Methyloligella halotolerans]